MSEAPAIDKGKGTYIPTAKKKFIPPMSPERIVSGAPVALTTFLSEEEGPTLRGDDIITPFAGMPVES